MKSTFEKSSVEQIHQRFDQELERFSNRETGQSATIDASFKGESYRDEVFAYIEQEDTPRPLMYQIDLLREAGFNRVEVLHKNSCFAAFGDIK